MSSIICDYRRAHNTQHYFLSYSFLAKRDRSKMIGAYNSNLFIKGIWLQNSWSSNSQIGTLCNWVIIFFDYLSRLKLRTKINSSYRSWYDIIIGVHEGLISKLLLFNIFINYSFFIIAVSGVSTFANDNTLNSSNKREDIVIRSLETDLNNLLTIIRLGFLG